MSSHLITLKCGTTGPGARPETGNDLRDVATGRMPALWAGAKTGFRLLFQNPKTGASLDTSSWASVTFRLMADDKATVYATKTVLAGALLAGPPKETTVNLTTTETALPEGKYWLSVFATLSAGGLLPLAIGPLSVVDGGMLTTAAVGVTDPVYTQAEVDALLAGGGGGGVNGLTFSMQNGVLIVTDAQGVQWRSQQLVPN